MVQLFGGVLVGVQVFPHLLGWPRCSVATLNRINTIKVCCLSPDARDDFVAVIFSIKEGILEMWVVHPYEIVQTLDVGVQALESVGQNSE